MSFIITGANGFIARNLIAHLSTIDKKTKIIGLTHSLVHNNYPSNVEILKYNPDDEKSIQSILKAVKPKKIFHFAAQSNPSLSWEYPELTIDSNYKLTLYILNSIVNLKSKAHIYTISSSSIYNESKKQISENDDLDLNTPYALSKFIQEDLSEIFYKRYGVMSTIIRPFCVTGPGKTADVISDWAKGIIEVENRESDKLKVGNISGIARDFLHIKDFNNAFLTIVKSNKQGTFNICSGKKMYLKDLLAIFLSKSRFNIKVTTDKSKLRKVNDSIIYGCNKKIRQLGWVQRYSIEEIIEDQLTYYRRQK
jgi:GDP-4-dehydro-6-deoxy-D-mannose reductase